MNCLGFYMVKKIFNFLNKEIKGLHEAAYLLAFFAFLSQLLALVRDRFLAGSFGASQTLDIYYAAFRIPDLIFVSVASLVSVSVFVPFLVERLEKDREMTKKFIDNIFSFFFSLIIVVSAIVFLLMPVLVRSFFLGVDVGIQADTIVLSRIMLLSPILLGLSNFLASITQAHKRFLIYAVSPLLYNAGIIIGAVFFYPIFGISGLAYGVILGAFMHLMIQMPAVIGDKLFPKFRIPFDWAIIKEVVFISLPRTITLAFSQISTIILTSLASLMSVGSISVFNLSLNLQSVPISIIGVSYSTALFPTLSSFATNKDYNSFKLSIATAIRHIVFWSWPIIILFIVLRAQIVRTILGSGSFSWSDTRLTAASLAIFVISALAQSLILLFVRGYYSNGNTKKPLYINFVFAGLGVLFAFLAMKLFANFPLFRFFVESLFKVSDLKGTEVLMLPLGFVSAQILNIIVLWLSFEKDFKGISKGLFIPFFQSFSASIIMGFVTYLGLNLFGPIFGLTTVLGVFLQGFLSGILGIIVGIIILKLLKNKEIEEIWATLHKKIWKTKVIVPEQESL